MNTANSNMVTMPIVMTTGATIPANSGGTTPPISFDVTTVQNTFRVPIEITEILVSVFGREITGSAIALRGYKGTNVEIEFGVGRHALTDGFIPFVLLAPWNSADATFNRANESEAGGSKEVEARTTRRIILPQPIRLAPGIGFTGRVRSRLPTNVVGTVTGTQYVRMTFIGRVSPGGISTPTAQALPLWSHARFSFVRRTPRFQVFESAESELRNFANSDLDVTRIIAAGMKTESNVAVPLFNLQAGFQMLAPEIQLRWPNGDLLNAEREVISPALFLRNNCFAQPFTLPPNTRVKAKIKYGADSLTDAYDYLLALFGTRIEVL